MHKACGFIVFNRVKNTALWGGLYTYPHMLMRALGYKSSELPHTCTQVLHGAVHNFFNLMTAVKDIVLHTIHTTNKNNKDFYIHNLLLIYRKAVY